MNTGNRASFQRDDDTADLVRTVALSSARLWEEVLERLTKLEESQAELVQTVSRLQDDYALGAGGTGRTMAIGPAQPVDAVALLTGQPADVPGAHVRPPSDLGFDAPAAYEDVDVRVIPSQPSEADPDLWSRTDTQADVTVAGSPPPPPPPPAGFAPDTGLAGTAGADFGFAPPPPPPPPPPPAGFAPDAGLVAGGADFDFAPPPPPPPPAGFAAEGAEPPTQVVPVGSSLPPGFAGVTSSGGFADLAQATVDTAAAPGGGTGPVPGMEGAPLPPPPPEAAAEPPITPDFFARAGRRRR